MIEIKKKEKNILLICKKDDMEIGRINIEKINNYLGYLKNLYVNKGYRKMGIGYLLIQKAVEISKKEGLKKLSLTINQKNIPSIKLFLRWEFIKEAILREHFQSPEGTLLVFSKFL